MDKRTSDRRSASRNVVFPINDNSGSYVGEDRRSGLDRRKFKTDDIAFNILDSVGL